MIEQNLLPGYSLRRDYMLWVLLIALLVLSAYAPGKIVTYPTLVDWPTIQTLFGLLILTQGIEASGWLARMSEHIAVHIRSERMLALFLMGLSVLLAMFLTNDIALFVVVPLTLSLAGIMQLPLQRLVIFEALAVNAGSMLTPIGNPQNIFLWQHSGVGFGTFVWQMLPLCALCLVMLTIFTLTAFRTNAIQIKEIQPAIPLNRRLLWMSVTLYVPFVVLADLHYTIVALLLAVLPMLVMAPRILRQIDWPLMAVFVLMFIDLRLLAEQTWLVHAITTLDLHRPGALFATGALLSQGISNVPATILLAKFSDNWGTLAWAVNVGGFGTVIGSLANFIALRVGRQRGALPAFHAWSVGFFVLVGGLVWLGLTLAAS